MSAANSVVWHGCFDDNWKNLLVPEAFAHPAKYARGLISRIYAHALTEGWLKPGDVVVDPFGGVCCGAYDAMLHGLHWRGCELEPRFVALGQQNLDLWQKRFGHVPDWGTAELVQGDSRQLASLLGQASSVVSSPPYADITNTGEYRDPEKTIAREERHLARHPELKGKRPPFLPYGTTPGQLGAMPAGDVNAVVSSPPYDGKPLEGGTKGRREGNVLTKWCQDNGRNPDAASRKQLYEVYGEAVGNLGNEQGDTFWEAARQIVQQCHAILKPGGVSVWVVKNFVRNKQIVPFSDQWRMLCESQGFVMVQWIGASLVHETRQPDLFGGEAVKRKKRMSFFRRLHEAKAPHLAIGHEDVLILRKESPS